MWDISNTKASAIFHHRVCSTYITAVVDESGHIPIPGGINDVVVVDSEQVTTANSSGFVSPFPLISHGLSDDLSNIFNDHLISCYIFYGKETPVVNCGLGKLEKFLPCLRREGERVCDYIKWWSSPSADCTLPGHWRYHQY